MQGQHSVHAEGEVSVFHSSLWFRSVGQTSEFPSPRLHTSLLPLHSHPAPASNPGPPPVSPPCLRPPPPPSSPPPSRCPAARFRSGGRGASPSAPSPPLPPPRPSPPRRPPRCDRLAFTRAVAMYRISFQFSCRIEPTEIAELGVR